MSRRIFFAVFALLLTFVGASPGSAQSSLPEQPLRIVSKAATHDFTVEMALTSEQQARGLMFRRQLAEGRGMLFDFHSDAPRSMWMKDTFIPLDMVFIRADGRIHRIEEYTEPQSLREIPSGAPVRAVLELIAGSTRKLGLAAGDQVVHPIFGKGR